MTARRESPAGPRRGAPDATPSRSPGPRHVLTVVHAAERSGPPLLALRFLEWLRVQRPTWTLSTLSLGGDTELLEDFARLGPTRVAAPARPDRSGSLRRLAASGSNRRIWVDIRRRGPVDVVHVHCLGSMRVLDVVPADVPVLCHVHELSVGQDFHLGPRARAHVTDADRYVTVSDVVTRDLLGRFPIDPSKVERHWGFLPSDLPHRPVDRSLLGLDEDRFVVVSAGVRHWRKAPELFVRTARAASRRRPDVPWQFVWVGGSDTGSLSRLLDDAGLQDVVRFVEHRADALRWLAAADAFVLPAREDAFPLVCIEAAALGLPVVTFDSGGAVELVEHAGCGHVAPFPDVELIVTHLARLATDPAHRRTLGRNGREFARQHLTITSAGPLLMDALTRTMGHPSAERAAAPDLSDR